MFSNPFINTLPHINNTNDFNVDFLITISNMQEQVVYEKKNIDQSEIELLDLEEGLYMLKFSIKTINI